MIQAVSVRFFCPWFTAGLILWLAMATGCNKKNAQTASHPIRNHLVQQLEASCHITGIAYHKSVVDLTLPNPQTEDSLISPEAFADAQTSGSATACLLLQDIEAGFEQFYDAPYFQEHLNVQTTGDTIIARISEGHENQIPLQLQKVFTNAKGHIEYYEVITQQKSWLYNSGMHMQLYFDSLGIYKNHRLSLFTRVPMISQEVNAQITGKAIYHE
ncbi:MAG: hypothetical protein R3C61_00480 [Bacteroidia bacterium]